jgi:hypothetical protein
MCLLIKGKNIRKQMFLRGNSARRVRDAGFRQESRREEVEGGRVIADAKKGVTITRNALI